MARMTPDQESLNVRLALAILKADDLAAALADLLGEPALTSRQRRLVESQVGHAQGLSESLALARPTGTIGGRA